MVPLGRSLFPVVGSASLCAALAVGVLTWPARAFAQQEHGAETSASSVEDHPATEAHGDHAAGSSGSPAAGEEHASDDPAGTPPLLSVDVGSAVCNIAIFLGVFAILAKFVWPVVLHGLQAREDKIHGDLEAAAKANAEAKTLLSQYQSKLDEATGQVQAMLAEARRNAESAGQRIVEEAKSEAERQRERAVADIQTAKKVALSELAAQTSDLAISVARQVVGRELRAEDHADLLRQALDRMPSHN